MNLYYKLGSNLYVNITNLCSCDCLFCIRSTKNGVGSADNLWLEREPTLDELKEAFAIQINQNEVNEIVFCGFGEPLERAEVAVNLARYIKQVVSIPVRLNTNGLVKLINPDFDICKLSIFDKISVSLNADTSKEYVNITRSRFGEESFDVMLDFAKSVHEFTKVQFTIVETLEHKRQKKCRQIAEGLNIPLYVRSIM